MLADGDAQLCERMNLMDLICSSVTRDNHKVYIHAPFGPDSGLWQKTSRLAGKRKLAGSQTWLICPGGHLETLAQPRLKNPIDGHVMARVRPTQRRKLACQLGYECPFHFAQPLFSALYILRVHRYLSGPLVAQTAWGGDEVKYNLPSSTHTHNSVPVTQRHMDKRCSLHTWTVVC